LKRDHYLCQCQHCRAEGRTTLATEVDHVVSRAKAKALGWSEARTESDDNLQSINETCHRRKTQEERGKTFKEKEVIGLDGFPVMRRGASRF
jgi:5-methylcytosine-specific restriction protein A